MRLAIYETKSQAEKAVLHSHARNPPYQCLPFPALLRHQLTRNAYTKTNVDQPSKRY